MSLWELDPDSEYEEPGLFCPACSEYKLIETMSAHLVKLSCGTEIYQRTRDSQRWYSFPAHNWTVRR